MSIIRQELNINDRLTDAQILEIKKASSLSIKYDADCPELTDEQLQKFRPYRECSYNSRYSIAEHELSVAYSAPAYQSN